MNYIGVDPGFDGAMVVTDEKGGIVEMEAMPVFVTEKSKRRKIRSNEDNPEGKKTKSVIGKQRNIDIPLLVKFFDKYKTTTKMVFLERAAPRPFEGTVSTFHFGEGYGIVKGVLTALGISYTLIGPSEWTAKMHLGTSKELKAKDRSLLAIKRLRPDLNCILPGKKVAHKGIVDAALIVDFGREREING